MSTLRFKFNTESSTDSENHQVFANTISERVKATQLQSAINSEHIKMALQIIYNRHYRFGWLLFISINPIDFLLTE